MDTNNNIQHSKPVPPFVRYCSAIIPTAFDDSLSYYEALCALWKWMQDNLVNVINNNAAVTEEYIRLTKELKEFVENYFDNLDVQEEINNKLDAMAEAGTLQEIVGEYLNATATWGFDTVADMKSSTNLIEGSYAQTLGYYNLNDGGGALYKIRKVTNDDTVDEAFLLEIGDPEDELVAELIYDDEVSILQLGAQKYEGVKHDIKPYIEKYLAKLNDVKRITLKIPYGLYHCDAIQITQSFDIVGDEGFGLHNIRQSVITSLNENQEYILSVGSQTALCRNFVLKNLTFTSAEFTYNNGNYSLASYKAIDNAVIMRHACFGVTDNLFFDSIDGTALKITTSFEIYFKLLNFRNIDARENGILRFAEKLDSLLSYPNISACNFEKIMFEETLGDLMYFEHACRFTNNHFGVINFEDHAITRTGVTQTIFNDDNVPVYEESSPIHWAVFAFAGGGEFGGTNVGSLDLNNFSYRFTTISGQNYAYDRIVNIPIQYAYINTCIDNINVAGQLKNADLIYSHENVYEKSYFKVSKVTTNSAFDLLLNVDNFTYIECDTRITGIYNDIKPFLLSSTTPAYKVAVNRNASAQRVLKYDADAENHTKVCVKVDKTHVGACFKLDKTSLYIRAKIADGATPTLSISGSHYATTQLTGTGSFAVYQLNLHGSATVGDTVQFGSPSSSTGEEILIDWIA